MRRRRGQLGSRRGGVYVLVLGSAMLLSLVGAAAMSMLWAQRASVLAATDAEQARIYAESAVELGLQAIASDSNWRANRTNGTWLASQALGDGTISLDGTDPVDGNLANRPTDAVVLKGTGRRGAATQMVEVTLGASGAAIDALGMALHTQGQLQVRTGGSLTVTGAPASTNTVLRVDGSVAGSAECQAKTGSGSVSGSLTVGASSKAMPDSGLLAMFTSLGTVISPPSTIERVVLAPGYNPWSAASTNADGVYVINLSANLTIRNCRINGTLVINGSGKTVTIESSVLLQPARTDYPVIITDANLIVQFTSGTLSESSVGVNLNPAGAAYLGVGDSDTLDSYPSEIQGLVHTRGTLTFGQTSVVRGSMICESAATSAAVDVSGTPQIIYTASLASSPPMGYMKSVSMSAKSGSWRQVVNP